MTPTQTRNLVIGIFVLSDILIILAVGVFVYYNFFREDDRVKNQEAQAASLNVGPEYHAWAYASSEYRAAAVCPREADLKFHTDVPEMTFTISKAGQHMLTMKLGPGGFKSDHVVFLSLDADWRILREVRFEEIGIEPASAQAMEKTGWSGEFTDRIGQKITEYLEKHAGEIFGEKTSEPEA